MHCLAEFGRLLEIGKYDMANRSKLPMHAMLKGISYESITLDMLWVCPRRAQEVGRPCMRLAVTAVAAEFGHCASHRLSATPAAVHLLQTPAWAVCVYPFVCLLK